MSCRAFLGEKYCFIFVNGYSPFCEIGGCWEDEMRDFLAGSRHCIQTFQAFKS